MSKILRFFLAIYLFFAPAAAWAASEGAQKLRTANGLGGFSPPEAFLDGNFVADEIEPRYVFGKVKDFRKTRTCSTEWLIQESERSEIKEKQNQPDPFEYTIYLEEDCPGKVAYYVFVDRSHAKSAQWMEWRRKFHGKSKTDPEFANVGAALEKADQNGFPVNAELRFIEIEGDLVSKRPEDFLRTDLKTSPIYDLGKSSKIE